MLAAKYCPSLFSSSQNRLFDFFCVNQASATSYFGNKKQTHKNTFKSLAMQSITGLLFMKIPKGAGLCLIQVGIFYRHYDLDFLWATALLKRCTVLRWAFISTNYFFRMILFDLRLVNTVIFFPRNNDIESYSLLRLWSTYMSCKISERDYYCFAIGIVLSNVQPTPSTSFLSFTKSLFFFIGFLLAIDLALFKSIYTISRRMPFVQ